MDKDQLTVTCKNLVKSYGKGEGKIVALRGVDLEVKSGELTMLAGPSGCGKTTLISVIASILNQDSGECLVFGNDLNRMSKIERIAYQAVSLERVQSQTFLALNSVNLYKALGGGWQVDQTLIGREDNLLSSGLGRKIKYL